MSLWFTIPLEAGIIAAFIAFIRHSRAKGLYTNGIIESCLAMGTDRDCLQVRAYVDETLVHELAASSKLIGRMFIRETNTSVPLIFGFDPLPNFAVHPGQLVDVYIGER